MQLVLRGHKTKREADYGSKKIGSFTEKRERESKAGGREGGVRPKSLSQDFASGQFGDAGAAQSTRALESSKDWSRNLRIPPE